MIVLFLGLVDFFIVEGIKFPKFAYPATTSFNPLISDFHQ